VKGNESRVKANYSTRVKGWNGAKGCHPSGRDRKEIDGGSQRETFITSMIHKKPWILE